MRHTIEISDKQYQAYMAGEDINVRSPYKTWQPKGGAFIAKASYGYPTRNMANRARAFISPHARFVAYAVEHWGDYSEIPADSAFTPDLFEPMKSPGGTWKAILCMRHKAPWIPYGPLYKVEELCNRLNTHRVQF